MREYSYALNEDTNELTIYEDNCILATISEVMDDESAERLMDEIVQELRGEKIYA